MRSNLSKICILVLALAMMLSLFACSGDETETTAAPETESTEAATTDTVTDDVTDGETTEVTTEATDEATTEETEETTEETGCYHPYAATSDGHYKPACSVCGKGDGKMMSHEWDDDVEDEGDVLLYSYFCTVCEYVAYAQEVPYDVSLFIAPSDFVSAPVSGFGDASVVVENGMAFTRFTASGGTASSYISAYQGTIDDDMAGRYMVMKVRVGGTRSSVKFAVSTLASSALDIDVGNSAGRLSATADGISSSWSTVVVDLNKVATDKQGFIPDASGDYYIEEFRIIFDGGNAYAAGETFDVAYLMFCETLEEAEDFALSASAGYYKYEDILANSAPVTAGKICDHKYTFTDTTHSMQACDVCGAPATSDVEHAIGTGVVGENHIFGCVCGYELFRMTVPSEVNVFMGASALASSAAGHHAWSSAEVMYEAGSEAFARIYGKTKNSNGVDIGDSYKTWDPYKYGTATTGQYFVMKYRIGENGLGQSTLKLYTSTSRVTATDETDGLVLPASEDNQWITVVVDLAHATGTSKGTTYLPAADGTYAMTFVQVRLFSGRIAEEDDYTDIAYMAVCDSLSEAKAIISDEMFYYKSTTGPGAWLKTDGNCVTHTIDETLENGTYTYTCSTCGNTIGSCSVPESVNHYISASGVLKGAVNYYQITQESFGVDDGVPYARLRGQGTVGQVIWTRIGGDNDAVSWPAAQISPIDAGKANYLVIKMRSNNDIASLALKVGTIIGEATFENRGNQHAVDIHIPQNVLNGDEWTTFVIDLSQTMGAGWVADENGNYTVSYLQLTFNSAGNNIFTTSTFFDFAYLAFCDSWSEVDEMVDEETVRLITSSNASVESGADGKCKAHTVVEKVNGTNYTYTCQLCNASLAERTVPADVNKYISASTMIGNMHYQVEKLSHVVEDGVSYVRFYSTQSTHINIWSVPSDVGNGEAMSIGASTGRYLVMRYRSENLLYLSLRVGTGGDSNTDRHSEFEQRFSLNDGWETMVIDLSTIEKYECNAPAGTTVQIRLDGFKMEGAESYTVDIAYVAIVDSLSEAGELIAEETYSFYERSGAGAVVYNTATGTPAQ